MTRTSLGDIIGTMKLKRKPSLLKKERKPTQLQLLIHKFIIPETQKDKYFWGRESKFAKQLIEKYSFEFLNWVGIPFGYRVNSLIYFLSKDGRDYLNGQYFDFLKTKIIKSPEVKVSVESSSVLGDNIEITKKPKSLQEFLK